MAAHSPVSLVAGDHPAAHPDREHDALEGRGELDHDGRDSSQDQRRRISSAAEAQGASLAVLRLYSCVATLSCWCFFFLDETRGPSLAQSMVYLVFMDCCLWSC